MTENKRFTWKTVHGWQTSAFLKIMNGLDKKNQRLKEENEQLKREKERYKRLSEIRAENINNRILSLKEFINNCENEKVKNVLEDLFYSEVKEYDLAKENRELKKENENLNNVLEDFMLMLNRLQANPNDEILQSMSKDMLRMMEKDIIGDSE